MLSSCRSRVPPQPAVVPVLRRFRARRLKEKGRSFRESFLAKLCLLLRGTVAAPPERFGETLADEHIRGGAHMLAHGPAVRLHAHSFHSAV